MCGIAGFVGRGNEKILKEMTDALTHRGPDDEGFFVEDNIFLGHRRLSIIDLKTGQQPMFNEDKSIVVIFNGEIYNFQELKKDLGEHIFESNSDTEVIVHGYEKWGESVFEKLKGMFAIALWDSRTKKLILARDRFGEKPLYWSRGPLGFVFASELKALVAHPSFKKEVDFSSLAKYFFFEYIPAPHTIFKNIYKLKPGQQLVLQNTRVKIQPYWQMEFSHPPKTPLSLREIRENLENHIDQSVKEKLISDVPLGIFLSGGLDSSTIAYFAQKNSPSPIKTFSIGFEESSFDESKWARLIAKRLGTEHYEKVFSSKEMQDLIPVVFERLDEPLADASILPTYLLSKTARGRVTVALGGDGGDEFWLGYPTFLAHKVFPVFNLFPELIKKKLLRSLASSLPVSFKNFSLDFKASKFLDGVTVKDDLLRNQVWLSAFKPGELKTLFKEELLSDIESRIMEDLNKIRDENTGKSKWQQLVYVYAKHYLAEDILTKVDRASMMNSLEVRSPFLDHKLVDFINNLPDGLKFRRTKAKYLLKKLMAQHIGKDVISRKKKGFGMPTAQWLAGELKNELKELLNEEKIKKQGIFNYPYVNQLMNEHFEKRKNHRQKLWSLFVFQKWYEKWIT
jgi:asparagine synthase (glutamine-hydrolysing)